MAFSVDVFKKSLGSSSQNNSNENVDFGDFQSTLDKLKTIQLPSTQAKQQNKAKSSTSAGQYPAGQYPAGSIQGPQLSQTPQDNSIVGQVESIFGNLVNQAKTEISKLLPQQQQSANPIQTTPSANPQTLDFKNPEAGQSGTITQTAQNSQPLKATRNLLDEILKNPIDTLVVDPIKKVLDNTGVIGETIKNAAKNLYNNPLEYLNPSIKQTNQLIKDNPDLQKKLDDSLVGQAYKNTTDFLNAGIKGAINGALRVTLNSSDKVRNFLDTELKKPVSNGEKTAESIGEVIGTLATYAIGGEGAGLLGFGKAALPIVFATLGQTSLPSSTSLSARERNALFDSTAGAFLEAITPAKNLLSLESVSSLSKSLGVLSAQVYADSRSLGASHEDALAQVKDSALLMIGLHGIFVTGKLGDKLTQSASREGTMNFTPDEARANVQNSNLNGHPGGDIILKAADKAEQTGQNLEISQSAQKQSNVAKFLGLNTPAGNKFDIKFVDANVTKLKLLSETGTSQPKEDQTGIVKAFETARANAEPSKPETYYRGVEDTSKALEVSKDPAASYGKGVYLTDSQVIAKDYGSKVATITSKEPLKIKDVTEVERLNIVGSYGKEQDDYIKGLLGANYNALRIPDKNGDGNEVVVYDKNLLENTTEPEKTVVTDQADIQRIQNSIVEGESILKSGSFNGRKFSPEELQGVQKSVDNAKAKIGQEIKSQAQIDIPAKETELKNAYKTVSQDKLDLGLTSIYEELRAAEAGARIPIKDESGETTEVLGKKSSFPKWVTPELRSKKLFQQAIEVISQGVDGFTYSDNKDVQGLMHQVFDRLDEKTGVDTSQLRGDILNAYGDQAAKRVSKSNVGTKTGENKTTQSQSSKRENTKSSETKGSSSSETKQGKDTNGKTQKSPSEKVNSQYNDLGGYADLDAYKGSEEEKTQQREEVHYFTGHLENIEMPEIVQMAKEIVGDYPTIKKFRDFLDGTHPNGSFNTRNEIRLDPRIFSDPILATKVLAHELGHAIDFLPEGSMARGNILGRIASLKKYMGSFLKEYPDAPEELITSKDREKLRAEAQKQFKENAGSNPEISTEDILNVWNNIETRDPELEKYIASLNDNQKVEIAKAAMRGNIPEWFDYKKATIDAKRIYEDLLRQEILDRRLFDKKQIMTELKALSKFWKPFDENNPKVNPAYVKYRNSSPELYADAISVLLTRPDILEEKAPQFFKGFFNYLDSKPAAKSAFFDLQDTLFKGAEAVQSEREKNIRGMFSKGEDLFRVKLAEQQKRENDFTFRLKYELIDKNQKVIDKVNQAKKEGKIISDDENPIYALEGSNYVGGVVKSYVERNIQPVYKSLRQNKITWEDFGEVTFLDRVLNDRSELANPLGFDPKTAQTQLDFLRKNLGEKKWQVIQDLLPKFRDSTKAILEMPGADELFKPEVLKSALGNKEYATFQVLDYYETYIPAAMRSQIGTLKEISNPATATVVKNISILRAIEKNNVKRKIVEFNKKYFPKEIEDAKTVFNGKSKIPVEPDDSHLGFITTMEKGKYTGYYVDPYIAKTVERMTVGHQNAVIEVFKFMNNKLFRPLFITYNTGFQTFNAVRDFIRTYQNVPSLNLLNLLVNYGKAIKPSWDRAFEVPNKTIQEMEKSKMLSITYGDLTKGMSDEEKQIDAVIAKVGLSPLKGKKTNFFIKPFASLLGLIEKTGNFVETLPKVASYKMLNGKLPTNELASFIRNSIGSPDFLTKGAGYAWTNEVFLFSNTIKQGIRSDFNIAFNNPRTRGGWWFKRILTTFLPKLLMYGAILGLFGNQLKKMMDNVSEYDKTNYIVLPMGMKNGQTIYTRVPLDETGKVLGGILWKALGIGNNQEGWVKNITDLVNVAGGQLPSFSPALTSLFAAIQYMTGNNPYDFYRGRNVLTDTEFKAGGKYALQPFVTWELQSLGAGTFWNFAVTEKGPDKEWYQKLLDAPVLSNIIGRWVKISDYGQTEQNKKFQDDLNQQVAERSLDKKASIQDLVDKYKENPTPDNKKQIIKDFIKDQVGAAAPEDKRRTVSTAQSAITVALDRGQYDVNTDSIINAQSNDVKVKILQKVQKEMSEAEFKQYYSFLIKDKIISINVIKDLKRNK